MNKKAIYLVPLTLALLGGLPACEKEGPFEEAGEAIDETIDDAADQIEEAEEDLKRQD